MKVAIVGLGLIGGSIARDMREKKFCSDLIGVDSKPEHRSKARSLGLVDRTMSWEEAAIQADLMILAIPVDATVTLLPKILAIAAPSLVLTDMGSTKRAICQSVIQHQARSQFVASHPMAGTENSGPGAALSGLFIGKTAVICERERSSGKSLQIVESLYRALEMRIVNMSAEDHDLHAAFVSHLSHISSFVLANTVLTQEKNGRIIFDLAGGGFESTVRLAKSSPNMWAPIFEQNAENVADALQAYMAHLQAFYESIVNRQPEVLRHLMEDANRIRPVLENIGNKGSTPS